MATTSMAQQKADKTILFICEHGSAKSIVAAAHFNRIAESNGIHIEAISRGTNPDEVVPDKINRLLEGDGFPAHNSKPVRLTPADLNKADYVVSFSVLPPSFGNPVKVNRGTFHLSRLAIPRQEIRSSIASKDSFGASTMKIKNDLYELHA